MPSTTVSTTIETPMPSQTPERFNEATRESIYANGNLTSQFARTAAIIVGRVAPAPYWLPLQAVETPSNTRNGARTRI